MIEMFLVVVKMFITVLFIMLADKQHLLAIGDTLGTLHILEIPWSLKHPTPNEVGFV